VAIDFFLPLPKLSMAENGEPVPSSDEDSVSESEDTESSLWDDLICGKYFIKEV
jgi:hypothetical protein